MDERSDVAERDELAATKAIDDVAGEPAGDFHELCGGPRVHARPVHDGHAALGGVVAVHRTSPHVVRRATAETTTTAAGRQMR